MDREEAFRHTDHYRCRLCGQNSPITEILCTKPSCRAQLGIYGELVTAEQEMPQKVQPEPVPVVDDHNEDSPSSRTEKPPKPKKEKKQKVKKQKVKKQKEGYTEQSEYSLAPAACKPFMQKKTLFTWLHVLFLAIYSVMLFAGEEPSFYQNYDEILIAIAVFVVIAALGVILSQLEKYVLHGLLCLVQGAVCFVAGGLTAEREEGMWMILAQALAYGWLGFVSFIGISKKRRERVAEGQAYPFLRKKTVLICLDILYLLICSTLICFALDLFYHYIGDGFGAYTEDYWLPLGVQFAVTVLSIVLSSKGKSVLRGILLCLIGVGVALLAAMDGNLLMCMVITALIGLLYLWLGIVSLLREQ